MQQAGGILAIIAGGFALLAAGSTLMFGGIGATFASSNYQTVGGFGWEGIFFSCAAIALGVITLTAMSRGPAILLVVCAIAGAVFGGTLVAVFMAFVLLAGIIALFGKRYQMP